jgi:hypothetical protein
MTVARVLRSLAMFALLSAPACGSTSSGDEGDKPATFLPFEDAFQGYHDWKSMPATAKDGPPDPLHMGPLTVYINKVPPANSSEFPPGTIIVKETNEADVTKRKVFAMAKRGGDFNKTGAVGWEWFELENKANGYVTEKWRGLGPPKGESYGGDKNGGCNGCHKKAESNDFIWSDGLQLSSF